MRILIIEKQARTIQCIRTLLNDWYPLTEIRESINVCEVVHFLEEFQPGAIMVDVRIQKETALNAIRTLKTKCRSIIVIVLSMDHELENAALSAGADIFIRKSDPAEKLQQAFAVALQKMELRPGQLVRVQKAENVLH